MAKLYSRYVIAKEGVFPQELNVIGEDQWGHLITDSRYICYPQYGNPPSLYDGNGSDRITVKIGKFSPHRGEGSDRYGLPVIYGEIVLEGAIEDTRCIASRIYAERLLERTLKVEQLYVKLSEETDRQSVAFK